MTVKSSRSLKTYLTAMVSAILLFLGSIAALKAGLHLPSKICVAATVFIFASAAFGYSIGIEKSHGFAIAVGIYLMFLIPFTVGLVVRYWS